eukprot:GGOE01049937.1.p1 GENE.GGOE01049937.1~~GGOE01049937.1.p1  ORF type:complete len:294 (-),score=38.73 GGOE01049937.1:99-914(-)
MAERVSEGRGDPDSGEGSQEANAQLNSPSVPRPPEAVKCPGVVFLVRHGERLDRIDPTWRATARRPHDPPLTERGVLQALQLGIHLRGRGIKHIFSSPMIRAVQTADAIAEGLGLSGPCLRIDHSLLEFDGPVRRDLRRAPPMHGRSMLLSPSDLLPYSCRVDASYMSTVEVTLSDSGHEIGPLSSEVRCVSGFLKLLAGGAAQDTAVLAVGHGASISGCLKALGVHPNAPLAPYTGCTTVCHEGERWALQGVMHSREHLSMKQPSQRRER